MIAYRVAKSRFIGDLMGTGARLYGGRFNSVGVAVLYASETVALATLEILVHLDQHEPLTGYSYRRFEFDDTLCADVHDLPADWKSSPVPASVQRVGDGWIAAGTSPVLRVPSAVLVESYNYLINPRHPDFSRIVASPPLPLTLDPRLRPVIAPKGP